MTSFRSSTIEKNTVKDIVPPSFATVLDSVPISYKYQHMQVYIYFFTIYCLVHTT